MASLNVKSANFTYKKISILFDKIFIDNKIVHFDDIELFDFASEDNIKEIKSSISWGVAGALTFGVFGAAAGLLLGGNKKETTFVLSMKSGKASLNVKSANFTYKKISILFDKIFIDNKIVHFDDIELFDFASEDNIKEIKSSISWGVAGALTFGVFGA